MKFFGKKKTDAAMQNRINCIPFGGHCKIRRETKAVGDDKYVGHEAIS